MRARLTFEPNHSWVQTAIKYRGAEAFGLAEAAVTVKDSAAGMVI
jgi:hypothetical protein